MQVCGFIFALGGLEKSVTKIKLQIGMHNRVCKFVVVALPRLNHVIYASLCAKSLLIMIS